MDLNNNGKDDIQEIKDWFWAEETKLMDGAARIWDWVVAEANRIESLIEGAWTAIKAALKEAIGDILADPKSIGQVVADTLTIIARTSMAVVNEVKSDFLTALAGLAMPVTVLPAGA